MSDWEKLLPISALAIFFLRECFDMLKGRGKLALDEITQLRRQVDVLAVHVENFKATLQLTAKVASDLNVAFERLRQLESKAGQGARSRESGSS